MRTFAEFWPHYLREHASATNRRLHFAGTLAALLLLAVTVATGHWWLALALPFAGYGFAWLGHLRRGTGRRRSGTRSGPRGRPQDVRANAGRAHG
jgi:hypothetical protein